MKTKLRATVALWVLGNVFIPQQLFGYTRSLQLPDEIVQFTFKMVKASIFISRIARMEFGLQNRIFQR